jgi:hypothetical protein
MFNNNSSICSATINNTITAVKLCIYMLLYSIIFVVVVAVVDGGVVFFSYSV